MELAGDDRIIIPSGADKRAQARPFCPRSEKPKMAEGKSGVHPRPALECTELEPPATYLRYINVTLSSLMRPFRMLTRL